MDTPQKVNEFTQIIAEFSKYEEERNVLINDLTNIVNRLKSDISGINNIAKEPIMPLMQSEGVIYRLHEKIDNFKIANNKLSELVNRLNQLV